MNVLIVESGTLNAERVLAWLSAAGIPHHSRRVDDRRSFLNAITEQPPDVILADETDDELTQKGQLITLMHSDLEQFAYAASHDLQEPLRTISLFAKLLSTRYNGKFDIRADEYLKFVESAAQQMGALLEDLSIYTQLPLEPKNFEPVDLNEVLHHTLSFFRNAMEESGAAVLCGSLPVVMGTGAHLGLVFQHLIDNALKYHGSDPPLIRIDAAKLDDHWTLSVKDNGIGFPQQYAEQVFGPFKRLNKRDLNGTGLGLAICKRIVEVHGGRIWAISQEDLGSTFYFTIPPREQWQKSSSAVV